MWRTSKYNRIEEMHVFRSGQSGYVPIGLLIFEGGSRRIGRFAYSSDYLAAEGRRPLDPLACRSQPSGGQRLRERFIWPFTMQALTAGEKEFCRRYSQNWNSACRNFWLWAGCRARATWPLAQRPRLPRGGHPERTRRLGSFKARTFSKRCSSQQKIMKEGEASADQLAQLFIHSSDIGGARPKARIRVSDKEWIAKFSTWDDRFDNPGLKRFVWILLRPQDFESLTANCVSLAVGRFS